MARRSFLAGRRASFGHAAAGIGHAWRSQPNLRIQAGLGGLAVGLGLVLGLPSAGWAALVATIALVLALEVLNTAIEAIVDLVSPDFHPAAKAAKDAAAGAALIASLGALGVAAALFLPRLYRIAVGF